MATKAARLARIESIRALAAEGKNQTQIAQELGMHQPHVSKIMRANNIERARKSKAVLITRGNTTYQTPEGEVAFHVSVSCNGETMQGYANVSPVQLEQLANYARSLAVVYRP